MSHPFFKISKTPDPELLTLLNNNVIGTPGQGMLYQHLGVHNKIHQIADPYFVNLIRNKNVISTCCFCQRVTMNKGAEIKSFYIRYFSFSDHFRGKKTNPNPSIRKSTLREEIKSLLNGSGLSTSVNEKFYHYAYVDPRNTRSSLLCEEFGFQPVRQFTTILFSRLHPRENKKRKIEMISPDQREKVIQLLSDFYRDYTMFSYENLSGTRDYYVMKDEHGQITAGVQVNPDRWRIHSLPGATGKIIFHLFSSLPYLNRIFNKNYKFITLEGIYYRAGAEKDLELLFEHLLHHYKVYTAIIPVDADSNVYKTLKSLQLGIASKLNKEVRGNIIAKFVQFNNEQINLFKENPAYLSGIDVT